MQSTSTTTPSIVWLVRTKAIPSQLSNRRRGWTIQRQSASSKKFLREATEKYHRQFRGSKGEECLASRGLTVPAIVSEPEDRVYFRIGYVDDPEVGHEMYRGMLAIPYIRKSYEFGWGVAAIRFGCLEDHEHRGHGKYTSVAGDRPRLYNTLSLWKPSADIAITEGELDAIAAESCGIRAVGVPGSMLWQRYFRELFVGYRNVFILADGDDAGMGFANTVAADLPNAKIVPMPRGSDVNDFVLREGREALRDRLK